MTVWALPITPIHPSVMISTYLGNVLRRVPIQAHHSICECVLARQYAHCDCHSHWAPPVIGTHPLISPIPASGAHPHPPAHLSQPPIPIRPLSPPYKLLMQAPNALLRGWHIIFFFIVERSDARCQNIPTSLTVLVAPMIPACKYQISKAKSG